MMITHNDLLVAASYVVTVAVTYGSQTGAFGGTNKEISDKNPTPLTPAGWTFAIWGLIFTAQAAAVVYLLLRRDSSLVERKQRATAALAVPLAVGWLAEALWQFAFVQDSTAGMLASAALLVGAAAAFHEAARRAPAATAALPAPARALVCAAASVNAAWLLVATAVGVLIAAGRVAHVVLSAINACVTGAAVVLLGAAWAVGQRDAAYCFTLVWAFWGVHAGGGALYKNVAFVSTVAMIVFVSLGGALCAWRVVGRSRGAARGGGAADDASAQQALVQDEQ